MSPSAANTADVYITIAGVHYASGRPVQSKKVLYDSLTILDELNETPNTCQFVTLGFKPDRRQEIIITLGLTGDRIFAGYIQNVKQVYIGTPAFTQWQAKGIDYTTLLQGSHVVVKRYQNTTATAIGKDLIDTFAPGMGLTYHGIDPDLATIDEITFTFVDVATALSQLAQRIGGYWYIDYYKDIHLFVSETTASPIPWTPTHDSLDGFEFEEDDDDQISRATVEGGGSQALSGIDVGTTIIPIEAGNWYSPIGGTVVCGPQRITYTTVITGGSGALVGSGVTPSASPHILPAAGAGIDAGDHDYAYTWVTALGETLPSPLSRCSATAITDPTVAPTVSTTATGTPFGAGEGTRTIGSTVDYVYVYSGDPSFFAMTSLTLQSPSHSVVVIDNADPLNPGKSAPITVTMPFSPDTRVTNIYVYSRSSAIGDGLFYIQDVVVNNPAGINGTYIDIGPDNNAGSHPPVSSTANFKQAAISGVALGPVATTARKVYRTPVGSSQLKLQQTIPNNTDTTGTADSSSDASLGANVPTSDTSGITLASGTVPPGSTTLLATSTAFASSGGGWAVIGNGRQCIRYTGVSGNTLIGIPSAGNGAITAAISTGSTIIAAPCLTGIPASGAGSIQFPIVQGDAVNLLVSVNDTALQAFLATKRGGDGVIEDKSEATGLSETESRALATARLALLGVPRTAIKGSARDPLLASGKTLVVNLPSPAPVAVTGSFKIQRVTISAFRKGGLYPTYTVEASSRRFTFEDLIRQTLQKAA